MTAEIIVLNREGIAIAADSAVTSSLGEIDKISTSANKLFSLSDKHPVGIMVYGNSTLMDMPWETIVKVYRSTYLPKNGFPTLEEYAKNFISFLSYKNIRFQPFAERLYVQYFVSDVLRIIREIILQNMATITGEDQNIDENELSRIIKKTVNDAYSYYNNLSSLYVTAEQSRFIFKKYKRQIKDLIDSFSHEFPISNNDLLRLNELLISAFSKSILDGVSSGVVFAGFGEKEFLPMVKAYNIEGIVQINQNNTELEILKFMENQDKSSASEVNAAVIPYAQQEMACRFMEGVDPDYVEAEMEFLSDLFKDYADKVVSQLNKYNEATKKKILRKLKRYGQSMTKEFGENMEYFKDDRFTSPTVEAVGRLSKNELASMAEALVYITSLKRKVSSESETVAEPIDVAVITKGDGFIWIKRKHYFDPKLNPIYFMKRNKEVNDESYGNTENPAPNQ
jgi:hypothetical protein